jgi:hypothetical protein
MARTAHTVKQKEEIASHRPKPKRISARQNKSHGSEAIEGSHFDDGNLYHEEQPDDESDANADPKREAVKRTDAAIPLLALGKSVLPVGITQRTVPPPSLPVAPEHQLSPSAPTFSFPPANNLAPTNRQNPIPFQFRADVGSIPSPGQHYPSHPLPQHPHHVGIPGGPPHHPTRDQLLKMSLDELKELAAKRALSRPFIAETIRNKQKYVYPDHPHKVPCPARMMGPTHTYQNAFFIAPPSTPHGSELRCSHRFCRQNRIKFLYCGFCKTPVTRMKFDVRHAHQDKRGGDDQEAASILASLVGEQEDDTKYDTKEVEVM